MTQPQAVRVGIITENHFPRLGGMEFATHSLAQALNKLADTYVAVACATMPQFPRNFSYPYTVYRPRSFSILTDYLYRKSIKKMIKGEGINLLHGQMLHGGGRSAVEMGEKYGLPVVVASRGSDIQNVPEIGYGALLNTELKEKIRYTCNNADRIIVLSSINRDILLELGVPNEKITIIPNGVLYDEISKIPFEDARRKYNLPDEDFIIITVGRNRPVKRMDLLYQALALLKQNDKSKIRCISVGPKENLGELVKKFKIEEKVILSGPIESKVVNGFGQPPFPELINLYRAADLYVSVSYVESFNLSALDALACGLPVVVSPKQGIQDVIIEGETGFTLEKETPENLAEKLLELSTQKSELSRRKNTIRESVSHLTWQNIAKKIREIYSSLL